MTSGNDDLGSILSGVTPRRHRRDLAALFDQPGEAKESTPAPPAQTPPPDPPAPPTPPAPPPPPEQSAPLVPQAPPSLPVPATNEVSSYLQYLPAPYHADPFIGRFLMIFESILAPIERTVDNLPYYLDPHTTPDELVPWLASWIGEQMDENVVLAQQRKRVSRAAGLYRWQGTKKALREHLEVYTGHAPLIVENFDGLRLGQDAALGLNARLGQPRPNSVAITVTVDRLADVDEGVLRRIIEEQKPAHVGYSLEVRERPARPERRDRRAPRVLLP